MRPATNQPGVEVAGLRTPPNPFDLLAESAPELAEAARRLQSLAARKAEIDAKTAAFVRLAIAASVTTLDQAEIRRQVDDALVNGATKDELFEVLALASTVGLHSATVGLPVLVAELTAAGGNWQAGDQAVDDDRAELAQRYTAGRSYWARFNREFEGFLDQLLAVDPELFEAFMEFSLVPWRSGRLPAKTKELVYLALDVAVTHLYLPGARFHMRNALALGASIMELAAVLEIAVAFGLRSLEVGIPAVHAAGSERPGG
jgi:alkylhydroperoxidase/carboxymuconolactone decarboxylase family protein YurZ